MKKILIILLLFLTFPFFVFAQETVKERETSLEGTSVSKDTTSDKNIPSGDSNLRCGTTGIIPIARLLHSTNGSLSRISEKRAKLAIAATKIEQPNVAVNYLDSKLQQRQEYLHQICSSLERILTLIHDKEYNNVDGVLFSKDGKTLICVDGVIHPFGDKKPFDISGIYTIPDSVTTIGIGAFSFNTKLTGVIIPNSVSEIGFSTFFDCTGLTSVTIPDSVREIGCSAFEGCTGLTKATIPDSVTKIENNAFRNCPKLTIFTPAGSVAEKYAKENHIKVSVINLSSEVIRPLKQGEK